MIGMPAYDPSVERAFIGAVLMRPARLDTVRSLVSPEDFSNQNFRIVCDGIYSMHAANEAIDLVTLANHLKEKNQLETCGGEIFLAEIAESVISSANAENYASIIKEASIRRSIAALGHNLIAKATDPSTELSDFTAAARQIEESIAGVRGESGAISPADFIPEYLASLEQLQQGGGVVGVPSPWPLLNHYTAGFVPGEVTVFAGRAGTGKTAGALNTVLYAARKGYPSGILSLEMTKHALMNRFISTMSQVDAQKFRTGHFSDEDWQRIYESSAELKQLPIRIFDSRDIKPSQLRALCKKWKSDFDLKFLAIDYLQLVKPEVRSKVREQEVADISRQIKTMALDLEIPVLLLAQLNRGAETESRPRMGHLRESGAIEQDADVILFIIPWKNSAEALPNVEVTFDVAKGRNNAVGEFKLLYRRKYLQFVNLDYRPSSSPVHGDEHWANGE